MAKLEQNTRAAKLTWHYREIIDRLTVLIDANTQLYVVEREMLKSICTRTIPIHEVSEYVQCSRETAMALFAKQQQVLGEIDQLQAELYNRIMNVR